MTTSSETETLVQLTRREVAEYKAWSPEGEFFFLVDEQAQCYAVVDAPYDRKEFQPSIVVMARVVGDKVVIEEDITDKPLVEALIHNAHIPRDKIILAYDGEKLPDTPKTE